jgi:hypothetical protein
MKFDISEFYPCKEGVEYYAKKSSFRKAWNDCPRGDWMLWIATELEIDHRLLTKAKARCANTVRILMMTQPHIELIEAALRYAAGEIDREELRIHASTAMDALVATIIPPYSYAAATAAIASAVDTLSAGSAASYAATASTAYAIVSSDYSMAKGNSLAYESAGKTNQLQTANICRKELTDAVFEKIKEFQKK